MLRNCFIRLMVVWVLFPASRGVSFNPAPDFSDIHHDEHVTFFRTAASLDRQKLHWRVPIHGWIYEPEESVVRKAMVEKTLEAAYGLHANAATQQNFARRVNLLLSDNKGGQKIIIRIGAREFTIPASQPNGHFKTEISLRVAEVERYATGDMLNFAAVMPPGDRRQFMGQVKLVPPAGISVISDIDDTVKISNVTDHKHLFDYTFFKDSVAVPGMPERYQQWSRHNVSFHFVSSSPWHFYAPLLEFTHTEHFPWATFSLKMIRFKDTTMMNVFKKGTATKPKHIEPILQRYPGRTFILVGDSGEQDPEVYAQFMRKYPEQILKILIRNVTQSSASDARWQTTFQGLKKEKWQLFDNPSEIHVNVP